MKRTDRLTHIITLLLFLALAAYIAAYAVRTLGGSTVTAVASAAEVDLGGAAVGIVIREETVLTSGAAYVDITAKEGARVAAGAPVATASNGAAGPARANRRRELEREIERMSAALERLGSAGDRTGRDAALVDAARTLASAVARHDAGALDAAATGLEVLLLDTDGAATAENLAALRRELDSLDASAPAGSETLTAAFSGVFSAYVDGYEHFGPEDLENLTPAALRDMLRNGKETVAGAYGKLIGGYRWYFAAVMDAADAAGLAAGRTVRLNFGRLYSADLYAEVVSVSAPERGEAAVVFRCDTALADTLAMRDATAGVVFDSYSGIRVPADAVRRDGDGNTYVWAVTAMQLERKDVEVVYDGGDYVIVARGGDAGALREGNTVVVSGEELYEGKIME